MRSILAPACTPPDEGGLGYRAVVVNFRGCEYLNAMWRRLAALELYIHTPQLLP